MAASPLHNPLEAHLVATEDAPSTAEPSEAAESRSSASSARSKSSLSAGKQLEVPACFPWRKPTSAEKSTEKDDVADEAALMLGDLLHPFIHTMKRGVEMRVLLDDGKMLDVEASFDAGLTRLMLGVKQVTRDILLEDIERVSGPDEAEESCTTNSEHLSECCTTLVLSSTHFLTFCFESKRHREYFEVCVRAILASQRTAAAKHEAAKQEADGPWDAAVA